MAFYVADYDDHLPYTFALEYPPTRANADLVYSMMRRLGSSSSVSSSTPAVVATEGSEGGLSFSGEMAVMAVGVLLEVAQVLLALWWARRRLRRRQQEVSKPANLIELEER